MQKVKKPPSLDLIWARKRNYAKGVLGEMIALITFLQHEHILTEEEESLLACIQSSISTTKMHWNIGNRRSKVLFLDLMSKEKKKRSKQCTPS